ncbi:MAG: hypothetical protein WCP01_11150 [Methylococcaceae bacterium]
MICAKKLKYISLGLGALTMMGAGQAAFAHASILNTVNSGKAIGSTSFSRIGVNHACNGTTPITPVVAQSAVIPTIAPIISTATVTNNVAGAYTAQAGATVGQYLFTTSAAATPVTTLAGLFQLVQSKDVFSTSIEQRNAANAVIGWVSTKGSLQLNEHGEVPFRFTNVFFGANSCVHDVVVQLAVADICKTNSMPLSSASLSTTQGVNLWLDSTLGGSPAFPQAAIEAGAGTTNLTINRDPVQDPYPASCAHAPIVTAVDNVAATIQANAPATYTTGATALTSVKIQPSAADIEQLQFPGWGTPVTGNTFQ